MISAKSWSPPKRALDLRLDTAARSAAEAVRACRDASAFQRLVARVLDHLHEPNPQIAARNAIIKK
jgi:hypothetical protein